MSESIEIILTDHIGVGLKGQPVDHGQWIVMADGKHVGYMSKQPGAWFASIVSMSEETKTELIEAIEAKINYPIGGVAMPVDPDDEPEEEDE